MHQLVGQLLDVVGAAPRIDDLRNPGLLLQVDLRIAGDARGKIGRQRQGFIERVGVQRLRVAQRGGQRFHAGAHDIVERFLRGQAPAGSLAMRAQHHGFRILRVKLLHQLGPQHARGAHFGDLHEVVHADAPEKGDARGEAVDIQTCANARAQVLQAVR